MSDQDAVAAELCRCLLALSLPPKDLFADLGGDPKLPDTPESVAKAASFCSQAADLLRQLSHLIKAADATTLGLDKLSSTARTLIKRGKTDAPLVGILVEEISEEEAAAEENKAPLPAVAVLFAAASFGLDDDSLLRPWSTPETSSGASQVLESLAAKTALAVLLPAAVHAVKPTITAPSVHAAYETSKLEPYTGPGDWERALATGQLASLVKCLKKDEIWEESDYLWNDLLFPVLSAAVRDSSPTVQNYGLWALHHILMVSDVKALTPWISKLVDLVKKSVIGCDERAWPAAAAAATALALKVDPNISPFNSNFVALFDVLLEEAQRHAHSPSRVIIWLRTVPLALFVPLGVQLTRYFRIIMPLLLEWCVSIQKEVRLGAVRAVHAVIRATWPRMPAHAAVIWPVLEVVYQDEGILSAKPSAEILDAVVETAALMWTCAGEAFQDRIKEAADRQPSADAPVTLFKKVLESVENEQSKPRNAIKIEEL